MGYCFALVALACAITVSLAALVYLYPKEKNRIIALLQNLLIMKRAITLVAILLLLTETQAQISVRVKKTASGSEVDLKTNGKSSSSRDNGSKQETGDTKTTAPADSKTATKDTTARPATNAVPDETYNGPAKVQLKSFWRYMEKLRAGDMSALGNAERMLAQVKQNDAQYDISALETEVKSYREKVDGDAKANSQAAGKADAERSYYKNVWQKMIGVYSKGSDIQPGVYGKVYYDRVAEVNLEEYKSKKGTVSDNEARKFIELIDGMLSDYDNYLKRADRLRWNVTEVMVKSRNEENPQTKLKMLEQARYECEAVLKMSPDNAAFKQKLDEVNKLLGSAGSEAAKLYTSEFHKQHVGKIVWSSQPLVIGKEGTMSAAIRNEFKTGDAIFGTVYLGNTVTQLMNGNDRLRIVIKVDGGTAIWGGDLSYLIVPLTVQDKSYLQFALLPDEQWLKDNYAPYLAKENWTYSYFMDELARSGDISHTITCELDFPTSIQGNIKSSLSLDLGNGTTAIKALSVKLHDQLMATRTLPKAGMNNAAMEQQMVSIANNLGWKNTFLKAIITSSSWSIAKNELTGAILYRYVGAVCTTKDPDGKCYYQEFTFRQDYTGGGNYSSTLKYNSYGGKREIGCDKLK